MKPVDRPASSPKSSSSPVAQRFACGRFLWAWNGTGAVGAREWSFLWGTVIIQGEIVILRICACAVHVICKIYIIYIYICVHILHYEHLRTHTHTCQELFRTTYVSPVSTRLRGLNVRKLLLGWLVLKGVPFLLAGSKKGTIAKKDSFGAAGCSKLAGAEPTKVRRAKSISCSMIWGVQQIRA